MLCHYDSIFLCMLLMGDSSNSLYSNEVCSVRIILLFTEIASLIIYHIMMVDYFQLVDFEFCHVYRRMLSFLCLFPKYSWNFSRTFFYYIEANILKIKWNCCKFSTLNPVHTDYVSPTTIYTRSKQNGLKWL